MWYILVQCLPTTPSFMKSMIFTLVISTMVKSVEASRCNPAEECAWVVPSGWENTIFPKKGYNPQMKFITSSHYAMKINMSIHQGTLHKNYMQSLIRNVTKTEQILYTTINLSNFELTTLNSNLLFWFLGLFPPQCGVSFLGGITLSL